MDTSGTAGQLVDIKRTTAYGSPRAAKITLLTDADDVVSRTLAVNVSTQQTTNTKPQIGTLQLGATFDSLNTTDQGNGILNVEINSAIGAAGSSLGVTGTVNIDGVTGIQSDIFKHTQFNDDNVTYDVKNIYNMRAYIEGSYGAVSGNVHADRYYGFVVDNWRFPNTDMNIDDFYGFYVDAFYATAQEAAGEAMGSGTVSYTAVAGKPVGNTNNYAFYATVANAGTGENIGLYINGTGEGASGGTDYGIYVEGEFIKGYANYVSRTLNGDLSSYMLNIVSSNYSTNITSTDDSYTDKIIKNATYSISYQGTSVAATATNMYNLYVNTAINTTTGTNHSLNKVIGIESRLTVNTNQAVTADDVYLYRDYIDEVSSGTFAMDNLYHLYLSEPTHDGVNPTNQIGLYMEDFVEGTNNYGIVFADGSDGIYFGGVGGSNITGNSTTVTIDKAMKLFPQATAPVTCNAPNAGTLYVDSTPAVGELCFCDGSAWQGISSGTDANCS
jgi:hypothetical protein